MRASDLEVDRDSDFHARQRGALERPEAVSRRRVAGGNQGLRLCHGAKFLSELMVARCRRFFPELSLDDHLNNDIKLHTGDVTVSPRRPKR